MSIEAKANSYEVRVMKCQDPVLNTHYINVKDVYVLAELVRQRDGSVSISIIDDMTCYGKVDAIDFLMRVSASILKPVIDRSGNDTEEYLVDPGKAVLSFMTRQGVTK